MSHPRKNAVLLLFLFLLSPLLLSGCASTEAIQRGMNKIDDAWSSANKEIYRDVGTRSFQVSQKVAFTAMTKALTELGFIVKSQDLDSGFLYARAPMPTPLTRGEWDRVKPLVEPKMQSLAATEVDSITATLFVLSDENHDVLVNALI